MSSKVLFTSCKYTKYDPDETLPRKFVRLIDAMNMGPTVKGKLVAIKMHVGRNIGYTTIHPMFVKILVDKLKEYGADVYLTDQTVEGAANRGYTREYFDAPIVDACGVTGKYFYPVDVNFRTLKNVDIAGNIKDADVLIDLSHVKGHGSCGYGGACKNIAMGCVTDRTRSQIHNLEGGLVWDKNKCVHCGLCVTNCNHTANSFDEDGNYTIDYHACTFCQHCSKTCPTHAITMDAARFNDFQEGMALCTSTVLKNFKPGHIFYINFLMNITAVCDCWGMSTAPIVPDIGIMASQDMVAIERACVDAIKVEDFIPSGAPSGQELGTEGHLLYRLHGRDPFVQINLLEKYGMGSQNYEIEEIK